MTSPDSLEGKVAVVTGGGSGIGAESAKVLASKGARVAVVDLDITAARAVADGIDNAVAVECDVSKEDSVKAAFETVVSQLGPIDILHNNAGICITDDCAADELDASIWTKTLDVNLTGQFLCAKYAIKSMKESGGGAIVNTASVAGAYVGTVHTAYCAAKAGVIGLTRALVLTHAGQNIRTTAICPGSVETPMSRSALTAPAERERLIGGIPAGRIATPFDIAALVAFLASPAGGYLNGSVITADGGLTAV
jgi:NAD(P)-dependent dehydrogenase (short-subunit alcohol dehydrogenase family)